MKQIFFLMGGMVLFLGCQEKEGLSIKLTSEIESGDTLSLIDFAADRQLGKIPITRTISEIKVTKGFPRIAWIELFEKTRYLVVLDKDRTTHITVQEDTTVSTNFLGDSILTSFWRSDNTFFERHGDFIFSTNDLDSLSRFLEDFRLERKGALRQRSNILTKDILALMDFQNDSWSYSFRFFYGRIFKKLKADHEFFDFVATLDADGPWTSTFPSIFLYKVEIEFLRKVGRLENIHHFLDFLEQQVTNEGNRDFLKSLYLKGLIEQPRYWPQHQELLDAKVLKEIIVREQDNPYRFLFQKPTDVFLATQKGQVAHDFRAQNIEGKTVRLSDYKGKVVFIDNWASWCGPCIAERPSLKALRDELKDRYEIAFLFISLDSKKTHWMDFLEREQSLAPDTGELFIENGMRTEYGEKYNIKFIPKYMLIDQYGRIFNANLRSVEEGKARIMEILAQSNKRG